MKLMAMILIGLMAVMTVGAGQSYAATQTAKIASAKGVTIRVSGGTGYACTAKRLKKGTKVTLQPLSTKSKYVQTLAYGKLKTWSAGKISKALRHPKSHKVKTAGYTYYKVLKGNMVRYILAVKKVAPAKQKPAQAKKPEAVVEQTPPAKLTIKLMSAEPSYSDEAYSLSGTRLLLKDSGGQRIPLVAEGNDTEAAATAEVPAGTYEVSFPRLEEELVSGQTPYWFDSRSIAVKSGTTTVDIVLDPVPGRLCIELTENPETEDAVSVTVDGEAVDAPCELAIPAGFHEVAMTDPSGELVKTESIYVVPGAPTGVEL